MYKITFLDAAHYTKQEKDRTWIQMQRNQFFIVSIKGQ